VASNLVKSQQSTANQDTVENTKTKSIRLKCFIPWIGLVPLS